MSEITINEAVLPSGLPVYAASPAGATGCGSVVWLHERYGFVEHTKDYARKIAARGFAVVAPDLYYDFADPEGLHAGDARVGPIDDDVIDSRLVEAVEYLGKLGTADVSRLGMIGVCATGRYPIVYGSRRPIQAPVIYYGATNGWGVTDTHHEPLQDMVERVDAPFLGIFGERDHNIPVSDVCGFRDLLEEKNKSYEIVMYEDAPHGFINDTMPGRYRPAAEADAFERMIRFFSTNLAPAGVPPDLVTWEFKAVKSVDYDFSKNVRLA